MLAAPLFAPLATQVPQERSVKHLSRQVWALNLTSAEKLMPPR